MKYFVLSDIHSFYTEMMKSLRESGYDKSNTEHTLIVCGDIFDRGPESLKVYEFLVSVPSSNLILIKGNHEQLFLKLLDKDYPQEHDFHNGTVRTFCQIAKARKTGGVSKENYLECGLSYSDPAYPWYDKNFRACWKKIRDKVKQHPITNWLQSSAWLDYFELDRFIFVHSFIPVKLKDEFKFIAEDFTNKLSIPCHMLEYDANWRNSDDWKDAVWGNPWKNFKLGFFQPEANQGKTLVVGHWHTSDFYEALDLDFSYYHNCAPIYYSEGIIGLDGGCEFNFKTNSYIHPQNVMIIDEQFNCLDKHKNYLKDMKGNK